ncbi:MAG: response regulator [Bacteroidetes bacterium]|nr:response regulator [Bacteroidota bacterium]MCW5893981.1 response regulator [Bacteroidota bacterium]
MFDTTDHNTEEHVRQSGRLANIGILAGGIAQDFDNLLSIIQGHIALLDRSVPQNDDIKKRLAAINTAIGRGSLLVRQMLAFSGTAADGILRVQLNDEVKKFIEMFSGILPAGISVVTDLQEELPESDADRTVLHQALLNLALNARDAIIDGQGSGIITIRTKAMAGDNVRALFPEAQCDNYICLSVADTGKGMDEQTTRRAFEPFFTTKNQASGLGLSVVHGITRTLRGYVQVESDLGKGATFSLYIPADVHNNAGHKGAATMLNLRGSETILIVEDERMLRELLASTLKEFGYRVFSAEDGQEAMDIFRARGHEIDLVFSDIGLPYQNGLEIFMKMKSSRPDLKFIFSSGYLEPNTCENLLRAGAKKVVQKPFHGDEIVRTVRQILNGKNEVAAGTRN